MKRMHLLALSLIALAACGKHKDEALSQPPANEVWLSAEQNRQTQIQFTAVAEQPVGGLISTVGRMAFDDRKVAHVFSPVSGRVVRPLVDLGQRVRAGQPLALIDSPDLGSAVSDFRKAQAAFVAAEKEFLRQKELFEAHAGAQRDFEAAEANYQSALAERDRAKQRSDMFFGAEAKSVSQSYQLRSPIAGEVIARAANPGMELQGQYGGTGAPELYTVGELDTLWLLADLPESDVLRVKVGSPLSFRISSFPEEARQGRIDWVSGTLDPVTRTARVRCAVPNAKRLLKPEMFAQVSIQVGQTRALAIPRGAVVRIGNTTYAFVDRGTGPQGQHRFERRPISVNEHESGDLVPVQSGLQAGEKIVSQGSLLLAGMN